MKTFITIGILAIVFFGCATQTVDVEVSAGSSSSSSGGDQGCIPCSSCLDYEGLCSTCSDLVADVCEHFHPGSWPWSCSQGDPGPGTSCALTLHDYSASMHELYCCAPIGDAGGP